MPSVATVFSAGFRAGLTQPQNSVLEADEAFSDVLNSVADARDARRPDAPRVPERQPDAAARPPKPEADTERQAKRRAPDETKPEGKTTETPVAPPVVAEDGEETDEAETNDEAADALLMLGIVQAEPEAPVAATADADAVTRAAPIAPEAAEVPTPASIATAPVAAAEAVETAQAAAPKQGAAFKAELETAVAAENGDADAEVALPKISTETLSSLVKPLKASASPDGQPQANASNVSNVHPAQAPAPLEMLQAAISKHAQLSIGADHHEPAPEGVKPQVSSNAVAPNFAMTAQVNAPVNAQTHSVADATRVPVEQLAVEIATRAGKGERRFDIRLDPPELGRIDVRLEIDSKGNTTAKLIVERAETLDMLQRDARGLEKALQNAGLKTDAGGLQFSLQQDAQTQQGQHNSTPEMRAPARGGQAEAEIITEIATGNAALAAQLRGGVDIRI
ncbi:MAG TPA: flagellar hook-length control protein FliK [Xanthobacteraceae bacterium]|nr:flagellar hook-length control protein FliK [Xanthobacteraceae bacterium]